MTGFYLATGIVHHLLDHDLEWPRQQRTHRGRQSGELRWWLRGWLCSGGIKLEVALGGSDPDSTGTLAVQGPVHAASQATESPVCSAHTAT